MSNLAIHLPSMAAPRLRALVSPREHGAWGLLLVPLFTGSVAGAAGGHWLSLFLFLTAALALFWLRTPVESLLGTSPMRAQNAAERGACLTASAILAAMAAACLSLLLRDGQNQALLVIGAVSAVAFVAQSVLKGISRSTRMASQLVGAIGLTATAPAAYCVLTGRFGAPAIGLWFANWIFSGNQIHFVQLRIHAARAANFAEKFAQGQTFFAGQFLMLGLIAAAAAVGLAPRLAVFVFIPALLRGLAWFVARPEPLRVKALGWSELRQGILFGVLLGVAFLIG